VLERKNYEFDKMFPKAYFEPPPYDDLFRNNKAYKAKYWDDCFF
jgi:hypothetical protein